MLGLVSVLFTVGFLAWLIWGFASTPSPRRWADKGDIRVYTLGAAELQTILSEDIMVRVKIDGRMRSVLLPAGTNVLHIARVLAIDPDDLVLHRSKPPRGSH